MTSASTWNSARAARAALVHAAIAAAFLIAPRAARAVDEEGCLGCHGLSGFAIREAAKARPLGVSAEVFGRSMHAELECRECHAEIASIPHGEAKDVSCGQPCHARTIGGKDYSHENLYWEFAASSHGGAGATKISCLVCHPTPEPREGARRDKLNEARRCAACHRGSAQVLAWFQGRHFVALSGGSQRAPSCPDCHTTHRVLPASVAESTVNPARLADTCSSSVLGGERRGSCHGVLGPSAVEGATMNQLTRGSNRRGRLPVAFALVTGCLCAGLVVRAGVGLVRGR